ncbi:MAG: helix-turn-helix domain-containing protein [Actinomycetota bacterium]
MARHSQYLETAMRIVTTDGQQALTMQRVADELNCAVGTIYRYFPSKDALVAEVQRAALDLLLASYLLGQSQLDAFLAEREVESRHAALARVVAAATFWIVADETYPNEMKLSRGLFTDPEIVVATEEATRILPAALRLLGLGSQRLDQAVEQGVLAPGNGIERAIALVSGLTGITLISKFARWDEGLFDGHRHARLHLSDTLRAWGADPEDLALVDGLLLAFRDQWTLAPRVQDADR